MAPIVQILVIFLRNEEAAVTAQLSKLSRKTTGYTKSEHSRRGRGMFLAVPRHPTDRIQPGRFCLQTVSRRFTPEARRCTDNIVTSIFQALIEASISSSSCNNLASFL